jgi:hypothetical protein
MPDLSEDQLRALETGAVKVAIQPTNSIPDPEPAVIARAQEIYTELKTGKAAPVEDTISDSDKVAFLAHILEGVVYTKTYKLFNDNMLLSFRTISSTVQDLAHTLSISEEHTEPGCTPENRAARFNSLIACLSITAINGMAVHKYNLNTNSLQALSESWKALKVIVSTAELALIKQQYAVFANHLSELIKRAEDPSFWPTRALE